jgi:hypothetical protein
MKLIGDKTDSMASIGAQILICTHQLRALQSGDCACVLLAPTVKENKNHFAGRLYLIRSIIVGQRQYAWSNKKRKII